MKILACGSRDYSDAATVDAVLDRIFELFGQRGFCVIEGGAKGADQLAGKWVGAQKRNGRSIGHEVFSADWRTHGKAAGPIRNQQMLDEGRPDFVVAFTDDLSTSRGTADMVRRSQAIGLPVILVSR